MPRNTHDRSGGAAGREILAVVAHELSSPIAAVRAAALALRDPALGDEARTGLLDVIAGAAAQLARLADDLTRAAAAGEAALTVEPATCDVAAAAADAVAGARIAWPQTTILLESEPDVPAGVADAGRLRQILANLLDNARRHGRGAVVVRVGATPDAVTVSVADRGSGIAETDRERAFERGVRLADAAGPGSGLGLALSRELAEAMGGELDYVPGPEGGAAFVLTLRTER